MRRSFASAMEGRAIPPGAKRSKPKPMISSSPVVQVQHPTIRGMKTYLLLLLLLSVGLAVSCSVATPDPIPLKANSPIHIIVGTDTFPVDLADNETATAFQSLLPLRVEMTELNGNEKYFDLSGDLPTNATKPGTIEAGDLMLWGNNTLVLFYKSFPTSYPYTRIGKLSDPAGLAQALGTSDVHVQFIK